MRSTTAKEPKPVTQDTPLENLHQGRANIQGLFNLTWAYKLQ